MSADLKPCPFCGGPAELWRASRDRTAWIACMDKCSVLVSREHPDDESAIAAWNTRIADAEIAALTSQLDAIEADGTAEHTAAVDLRTQLARERVREKEKSARDCIARGQMRKEIVDLKAENERLREALAFYRDNWREPSGPGSARPTRDLSDDAGHKAFAALATQEDDQ